MIKTGGPQNNDATFRHELPLRGKISAYLELCKSNIALFTSISALTAFLLSAREFRPEGIILTIGIIFLSSGASALNQFLERRTDALMPRTFQRPLPSGRLVPRAALLFSAALILSGLFALLFTGSFSPPLFGAAGILWYDGVYTFLKKRTAFAVIPGALVGAVPVIIGWAAGGEGLFNPRLLIICFFFFMWQVPHSWLSILKYGKEYEIAGLPSLTSRFSSEQLSRINFIWISAVAVSCLFLLRGEIRNVLISSAICGLSLWVAWNGRRLLGKKNDSAHAVIFNKINVYILLVMILLSADVLIPV